MGVAEDPEGGLVFQRNDLVAEVRSNKWISLMLLGHRKHIAVLCHRIPDKLRDQVRPFQHGMRAVLFDD